MIVILVKVYLAFSWTFDFEIVLISEFQQVFLSLFKAKRCRDFIINIKLNSFEDNVALVIDDVAKSIN